MKLVLNLNIFICIILFVTGCGGGRESGELSTPSYYMSKETVFTPDPEDSSNSEVEVYEYDERNRQISSVNSHRDYYYFTRAFFDNNLSVSMSGQAAPSFGSTVGNHNIYTAIEVFKYSNDNPINSVSFFKRSDSYGPTEAFSNFTDFFLKTLSDDFLSFSESPDDDSLVLDYIYITSIII